MTVASEIQKLKKRYPDPLSAVMPALQVAQAENGGWLSPAAIREVADALDLTPAYCLSIASFYDQYYLEPIGRTHVEVCTNVSCALAGAQQVGSGEHRMRPVPRLLAGAHAQPRLDGGRRSAPSGNSGASRPSSMCRSCSSRSENLDSQ